MKSMGDSRLRGEIIPTKRIGRMASQSEEWPE
jgi:hypothetical protein